METMVRSHATFELTIELMHLDCGLCVVRDWSRADKGPLVRAADDRRVWRNLEDRFPHPYTEADADFWFALLEKMPERTNWAIAVEGEAAGGIGFDRGEGV